MAQNVVPFGKYKGQPVEVLAADREYTDWLLGQSWLKGKYQNIYTLIVNNFGEPSETPEHNALQALFLDNVFAEQVVAFHHARRIYTALGWEGWRGKRTRIWVGFEMMGADVYIRWDRWDDEKWFPIYGEEYRIELKPSVGDDYPAILRQIRNIRCPGVPILLLDRYVGEGASQVQFIEMFDRVGVKVVFRHEVMTRVSVNDEIKKQCGDICAAQKLLDERQWSIRDNRFDADLRSALEEQESFFREAVRSGDLDEIRVHGEATVRGWLAALKWWEDREIAHALRVFPGAKVIAIRPKS